MTYNWQKQKASDSPRDHQIKTTASRIASHKTNNAEHLNNPPAVNPTMATEIFTTPPALTEQRPTIYTPESPLRDPKRLVRDITIGMWRSRELIYILFMRDLKAQFRQSYFGYIWLILPPLMTTGVWVFLSSQQVVAIGDTGMPYPMFVIIGTVFWQFFAGALQSPLTAFNAGRPVFMKLKVPPEAFIAAGSARAVFDFTISLILIAPMYLALGITPPWTILLLPLAIVAMYLLGSAIGLLLLPIGGLYSDVTQAIQITLRFAMYLSPVVYPVPTQGLAATLIRLNPVTPAIECARSWLVSGPTDNIWPLLLWIPLSLAGCLFGLIALRVAMPHLIVRMGM